MLSVSGWMWYLQHESEGSLWEYCHTGQGWEDILPTEHKSWSGGCIGGLEDSE